MQDIETITPQYQLGDRVQHLSDHGIIGTVTKIYPSSGLPFYYGTRRIIHTHCYELTTKWGKHWGSVDAELEPYHGEV